MLNAHRRAHPRWLPAALFLLLFYASSGPATSSTTHTHTHVSIRRRLVAPPSSFHRFEPRSFSTFVPVTLARNSSLPPWPLAYRPWNLRRIGKYSICTRGETSPRPTVYICNTWSDAGQRRVHRPRCPMLPFFPSPVYLVASLLVISFETGKPAGGKEPQPGCSPVDSRNRITFKVERILLSVAFLFYFFAGNETEVLWRLINYRCVRNYKEDGIRGADESVFHSHEGGSARFLARHLRCSSNPAHLTLLLIV